MAEGEVTVNGKQFSLGGIAAHTTALEWLRGQNLSGSKEGCAEGECGACAVLVANTDGSTGTCWTAVNSCLVPVAALDGQEVVTSEGLGSVENLHPVQRELVDRGGSQCGYCTPGFVCSMAAEFYRESRAEDAANVHQKGACEEHGPNGFDLHALSGNLCRCTGYRPIRDAAYALGEPAANDPLAMRRAAPAPQPVATSLQATDGRFVRPQNLRDALALLSENPDAVVIAGSTDWGVEVNLRGRRAPLVLALDRLPELCSVHFGDEFFEIGAAVSLSESERILAGRIPLLSELFPAFASRLIRNRATFGGNLGTGSPIGDSPPVLLALDARIVLVSASHEREIPLSDYFTGYRTTVRNADELIRAIRIPLPLAPTVAFHKIAKRRFDDISSVSVAFAVDVKEGVLHRVRIGLGGVAATPIRARETEQFLVDKPWNAETVEHAALLLGKEGTPMDDHRASAAYRRSMLSEALLKFYVQNSQPRLTQTKDSPQ